MCGIAGIAASRPVNAQAVAAMNAILVHRGPDDEGLWSSEDGRTVLGHRRLSIIDLGAGGHQPMQLGKHVVTYNGEIYNYIELRQQLAAEGVHFESTSDTEVLLAAYEHWGPDFLARLNGMFAFAIYDGERHQLICARDRYGEKPFLYSRREDFFAFASEYKALFALDGISTDYDRTRVFRFLRDPSTGLDDRRQTVFDDIEQLLPGELLRLDLNTLEVTIKRYWSLQTDPSVGGLSQSDAESQFRELLTDAVKIRMRSDVSVGSCLSGGLDSSAIVCIARELIGADHPYDTFTGRFPANDADEGKWASVIVEHAGTLPHEAAPTGDKLIGQISEFMWHNELPVGSGSQFAQWSVFAAAKEAGVTVLLDGQGGDELLAGYEQYFGPYLASRRAAGAGGELSAEEKEIRTRYPLALLTRSQSAGQRLPRWLRHWGAGVLGQGSDFGLGLQYGFAASLDGSPPPFDTPDNLSPLTKALYRDSFEQVLPVLLRYGDRNSMAHSREVRLPFCDHRLAEFVFSLKPGHLMGNAETKRLLRGAMSDIVPAQIVQRWNKQGFVPPHQQWFQGALGRMVEDIIEAPEFGAEGIWRKAWWRTVLRRLRDGEAYAASLLWRPLIEYCWREHFVRPAQTMATTSIWSP